MQITAHEIAHILNGTLEGNSSVTVSQPSKIEEGGKGTLTFLANPKYEHFAYSTEVSILLVKEDFSASQPVLAEAIIRVKDVYAAVAKLLQLFENQLVDKKEVSSQSFVDSSAVVGENVSIGTFAVVEKGAKIGADTIIFPQVFIGKNAQIGKNVILYPGVKIHHNCVVGDDCILHSNVVIGGDGFGFAPEKDGTYTKIPQIGNVVIENRVEIGANTTIDRATMGSTVIKQGTKIDNLVMIAHNVEIGKNTVIAAQAGFAGSGKIGDNCRIGGQAGFVGHIKVANGAQVQAQSGVASPIKKENSAVYGSPALDYKNYLKSYAVFKQLPDLVKRINDLERQLAINKEQ